MSGVAGVGSAGLPIWAAGLLALVATAALGPAVLTVLRRRRVFDAPNPRSSHSELMPRGGGVAVALGASLALLMAGGGWDAPRIGLLLIAALMAGAGLVEDLHGVAVLPRLGAQLLCAGACAPLLLSGHRTAVDEVIALGGIIVWIVAFTNAFNFMDGINGISSAEALIAGLAFAWMGRGHSPLLELGGIVVAAAAIGFAPYNFPKALVFLGDVGSYYLGSVLAALFVVALQAHVGLVPAAAPLALYSADTGVTLVRRIRRGESWHQAHHSHTYQQLIDLGLSHPAVTGLVAVFVGLCSVIGLAFRDSSPIAALAGGVAIAAIAAAYLGSPILRARQQTPSRPMKT